MEARTDHSSEKASFKGQLLVCMCAHVSVCVNEPAFITY